MFCSNLQNAGFQETDLPQTFVNITLHAIRKLKLYFNLLPIASDALIVAWKDLPQCKIIYLEYLTVCFSYSKITEDRSLKLILGINLVGFISGSKLLGYGKFVSAIQQASAVQTSPACISIS